MDFSIVIVSFNTKELLADCLKSVLAAAKNLKVEIFVSDNNSHDGTAKMVKENFPAVNLIANKTNLGFSKANNIAIRKCRGKYLLVLNPDTRIMADTLVKMQGYMENHQDVGIATCRVELPNGELDPDCRRHFPTPWRAFSHFSGLAKIFRGSKVFDQYYFGYRSADGEHEIDACHGAFMMVKRSALAKVGLFDEDFFFYGEDLDWCWRFKEKGYKIMFAPITKIIHYKGAASGMKQISKHLTKATRESKRKALVESTRAMKLFYQKHYQDKYPFFVNWLMYLGIWILGKYRLLSA